MTAPEKTMQGAMQTIPTGVRDVQGMTDQRLVHRFLFAFDFCLIWLSATIAQELLVLLAKVMHHTIPPPLLQSQRIGALLLFSLLVVLLMQLQREYALFWKKSIRQETQLLGKAILCATLVTGLCIHLFGVSIGAAAPAILIVALSLMALVGCRRLLLSQSIEGLNEQRNVLIVGCGANGKILREVCGRPS